MDLTVRDVMTSTVVCVVDSAPFKEIVRLMQVHGVSALPVVDAEGRLAGVVSEADLLPKEASETDGEHHLFGPRRKRAQKAAGLDAAQLMSAPVAAVGPDATLREAARLILERKVKRLPVVDAGGRIIGIVSRADLLKVFLRPDNEILDEVTKRVLLQILCLDTVTATVHDGIVRLDGVVEQRSMLPLVVGLVKGVDGVIGVDSHLGYQVDDTARPGLPLTWGMMPSPYRRH
jgi:CBS-domain-containing membrane protein